MSTWATYPTDASFSTLYRALKGNGHMLPIAVVFNEVIFDDDFVEPGMRAFLTGIERCDSNTLTLFFYFGDDEEYNKKFFRRTFYSKDSTRQLLATETDNYDPYYSVSVDAKDTVSKYLRFF
jgi:hypothetical protein